MAYGKVRLEDAEEIQIELEQADRVYWKPADGRNRIRIMPPWSPETTRYFFATGFHYNIGPDEETVPCPRLAKVRDDCYLCKLADKLRKSSDEADAAEAKELYARKKYLMNIVDLDRPEKGVQIWAAGIKAIKEVHYYVRDRQYGDITDPENGYNLTVQKSGSGLNTEYLVKADRNPSDFTKSDAVRDNPELLDALEELPDLTAFLTYPSNAEMRTIYEGASKDEGDDVEEEEAPARPRRQVRPVSRAERPQFDDEQEESEEEEESETEEEPRLNRTRIARHERSTSETGAQRLSRALRSRQGR